MGWSEDAFLSLDKHWKLLSIIRGFRRRSREPWMQTRMLMWLVSRIAGGKAESPEELLPLPFDRRVKTQEEIENDKAALDALVAQCKEYNKQFDIMPSSEP